jgi:hypothetical protein
MTTAYITKRFTAGPLAGLLFTDTIPGFRDATEAAAWTTKHATVPVKPIAGGSSYLVEGASVQGER